MKAKEIIIEMGNEKIKVYSYLTGPSIFEKNKVENNIAKILDWANENEGIIISAE